METSTLGKLILAVVVILIIVGIIFMLNSPVLEGLRDALTILRLF